MQNKVGVSLLAVLVIGFVFVLPMKIVHADDTIDTSYDTPSYDAPSYDTVDTSYPTSYDTVDTSYPSYDTVDTSYPTYDTVDTSYPTYDQNCGCDYTYENGVAYSNDTYANQTTASQPFSQSFPSRPISFSAPAVSYPSPVVYQQAQQQQQQQQQQQIQPIVQPSNTTNNTCTGNSCNYTDNSNNSVTISNSGNTQTTVYPISHSSVQYPVQYTYPSYPQQTYNNVVCYISSSQNYGGNYGQTVYLSWSSSGATSAWLSGVGTVAPTGTMAVSSTGGTYTLTVSGPGGSNTCNTYVAAQSYPSVSLSQIPYTGFDFGPVGNALYWLSLLAFAASGAYLLVYYKGGMSLLASGAVARTTSMVTSAPARIVKSTAQKIENALTDEKPTLANLPVMPAALATVDSMVLARSKDGAAPRIIITRT
jgi:hypothetical protein